MSGIFVGELRLFPYDFIPQDWAECNGQLLSISANQALYSLIGVTYGGNGTSNFAVPDLRGRVPISKGQGTGLSNYARGAKGGAESVILSAAQAPSHTHTASATTTLAASSAAANSGDPTGRIPAGTGRTSVYTNAASNASLGAAAASTTVNVAANTGGGTAHENRPPYLALTWCIATVGLYPMRPG